MTTQPAILASAQAFFPKSANKKVRVASAWRRSDSTLERPSFGGGDGWSPVNDFATREVVSGLQSNDFSWVTLEATGTAKLHKDVRISDLI